MYTYCPMKQFRTLNNTLCRCQGGFEPVNFGSFHSLSSGLMTRPPALAEHKFVNPGRYNILKLKKEIWLFCVTVSFLHFYLFPVSDNVS